MTIEKKNKFEFYWSQWVHDSILTNCKKKNKTRLSICIVLIARITVLRRCTFSVCVWILMLLSAIRKMKRESWRGKALLSRFCGCFRRWPKYFLVLDATTIWNENYWGQLASLKCPVMYASLLNYIRIKCKKKFVSRWQNFSQNYSSINAKFIKQREAATKNTHPNRDSNRFINIFCRVRPNRKQQQQEYGKKNWRKHHQPC